MGKKAKELIRKQQNVDKWVDKQVTKSCSKSVWDVGSIYDKLYFDDILLLEATLTERLRRKSISKKKIQIKARYRKLGTEISSYEEFHCKTTQISEEKRILLGKMKIV